MTAFLNELKPSLEDTEALAHFGVKGMKWGVRKSDYSGASRATNREARKDAQEFARAKLFYGEGAGTRRKLIKAQVEAKAKRDPSYKKAFDHHLDQQDMSSHAQKARKERKRKDVKARTGRTARGLNRAINGPFAPAIATSVAVGAYGAAKNRGLDQKMAAVGKKKLKDFQNMQQVRTDKKLINELFKNAKW